MGKKKDSVALFEVISKSRERKHQAGLDVPQWMEGQAGTGDAPAKADPPAAPRAPEAPPVEPSSRRELVSSFLDKRVSLSLNYVSCGVVLLSFVLLLIAVF